MGAEPFSASATGVRVAVHLTPRAARAGIGGTIAAPGGPALRVQVTAPPDKGRANDALIALLAKEWHIAPGRLSIATGVKSRHKSIAVDDDPAARLAALRAWLKAKRADG